MIQPPRKSKSLAVAAAVAEEIRQRMSLPVEAKLAPALELAKTRELKIHVWPKTRAVDLQTRSTSRAEYGVAVAVLDRIKPEDDEDLKSDELTELAESIGDSLMGESIVLPAGDAVTVIGFEHQPLYDESYLESHRVFAAGILLTMTRTEPTEGRK